MRTFKLTLEYDGTGFAGFQSQGKGERTVQQTLEAAIFEVSGQESVVNAAGRTDAGVHARGQVVHFKTDWRIPEDRLAHALNGVLPRDLVARSGQEVPSGFHARFSATERTYVYLVWQEAQRSALFGRFAAHEPDPLDLAEMNAAGRLLVGARDFVSFANAGGNPGTTTVRDLRRLEVRRVRFGDVGMLAFRVTANAFLRSMVRNLVGALMSVGRGELAPEDMTEILRTRDRMKNPCRTAPAHGLCLWRVDYRTGPARIGPLENREAT